MHALPLCDLRIRGPRHELRLPDPEPLEELVRVAARGVHDSKFMPLGVPWTNRPSSQLGREAFQYRLLQLAQWSPQS